MIHIGLADLLHFLFFFLLGVKLVRQSDKRKKRGHGPGHQTQHCNHEEIRILGMLLSFFLEDVTNNI
jgi:hypothetical protein